MTISMNQIILAAAGLLDRYLNTVIVLLGFVEIGLFFAALFRLHHCKRTIEELNRNPDLRKIKVTRERRHIEKEYASTLDVSWEEFDDFCGLYQKRMIVYSMFSLGIQIFPLLGILGTVAGLFISLQSMEGIPNSELLFDGVRFALSSTILGIVAAVIFKFFDIFLNSVYVNYIDDGIARFQDNYREDREFSREERLGLAGEESRNSRAGEVMDGEPESSEYLPGDLK